MQALAKNKTTIKIVGVFIVLMLIYNIFFTSDAAIPAQAAASPSVLGADLLKISDELSKAKLSQELFSSPAYLHLTDFAVPLSQGPVGRANPFDIIGRD